jgi:hypothetical protein
LGSVSAAIAATIARAAIRIHRELFQDGMIIRRVFSDCFEWVELGEVRPRPSRVIKRNPSLSRKGWGRQVFVLEALTSKRKGLGAKNALAINSSRSPSINRRWQTSCLKSSAFAQAITYARLHSISRSSLLSNHSSFLPHPPAP